VTKIQDTPKWPTRKRRENTRRRLQRRRGKRA